MAKLEQAQVIDLQELLLLLLFFFFFFFFFFLLLFFLLLFVNRLLVFLSAKAVLRELKCP